MPHPSNAISASTSAAANPCRTARRKSAELPARETLRLSRRHLRLRFPSSGARMQVQPADAVRARALHRVSAAGICRPATARACAARLHHCRWAAVRTHHASPTRCRAGHFERSKLAQDRADKTRRADGPRSDIGPPTLTPMHRTAEPRRERPPGALRAALAREDRGRSRLGSVPSRVEPLARGRHKPPPHAVARLTA